LRLCRFGLLGHASSLAEEMKAQARAATEGLAEAMAVATRQQVRRELALLVRAAFNARSYEQAELALVRLQAHASGKKLAKAIHANLDAALMHLQEYNRGLLRVAPEWLWRDLRLRLSRDETMAPTSVCSGPCWSGPSTATSRPRNAGLNASVTTTGPVRAPWPKPESRQDNLETISKYIIGCTCGTRSARRQI